MGFSVSGSFALIAIATLIATGMFVTATSDAVELITDAEGKVNDVDLTMRNTAVEFGNVTHNASGGNTLVIEANNTGATTLSLAATDVIVDNELRTTFDTRTVDGDASTDLWLPGETLRIELSITPPPDRVKLVTGPGVAIATEVS